MSFLGNRSLSPLLSPKGPHYLPLLSPRHSPSSGTTFPSSNGAFSLYNHSSRTGNPRPRSLTPCSYRISALKRELAPLQEVLQARERKKLLGKALLSRYQCRLTGRDIERMSEGEMLVKAKKVWARRIAKHCAVQMRKWLLSKQLERSQKGQIYMENRAAALIQRNWRRHRVVISAKDTVFCRNQAILCIQRHIRGYLARLRYRKLRIYRNISNMSLQYRIIK